MWGSAIAPSLLPLYSSAIPFSSEFAIARPDRSESAQYFLLSKNCQNAPT
ncbi:hypothetical protein CKA32_003483 [Geitlerinema sp. FC II]|nr:hypothetical protein CKA32_003483 [Geitlerinema sp. FC II]